MLLQKKKGIQLQAPQTLQLGLPPNLIFTIPLVVGQHPRHLGPYPRRQSRGLVVVQLGALPPPKHGKALAHPAAGANLRARNDVVVHMGHDLGGGGAVVLHHVPVVHARGGGERGRQHAHVVAQGARLAARRVGQLGPVGARAEQQVAPGQGHDVEEGDDEGRREHHEGRRAGEVAGDRGRRTEGVVGLVGGCDGAKGAVGGRGRRVEHDGDDGDDEGGGGGEGGDGAWGWGLRCARPKKLVGRQSMLAGESMMMCNGCGGNGVMKYGHERARARLELRMGSLEFGVWSMLSRGCCLAPGSRRRSRVGSAGAGTGSAAEMATAATSSKTPFVSRGRRARSVYCTE